MRKVIQSIIGSGEPGDPTGTCMRASLASIFECNEHDMQPFERQDLFSDSDWQDAFLDDLDRLGFEYHGVGEPERLNEWAEKYGVDGYVAAYGGSPRGFKRGHMVVYNKDGLVHDPHPSGDGISTFDGFYMITRK